MGGRMGAVASHARGWRFFQASGVLSRVFFVDCGLCVVDGLNTKTREIFGMWYTKFVHHCRSYGWGWTQESRVEGGLQPFVWHGTLTFPRPLIIKYTLYVYS
jgi:hypothetical protein